MDTIETLKEYIGDQSISILEKINLLGKIQYAMVKYKNNTIHFDLFPSGSEFKARRMNLGLTLSEVASLIDLPKSTISRLERGLEVYYSSVKAINEFYVRNGV